MNKRPMWDEVTAIRDAIQTDDPKETERLRDQVTNWRYWSDVQAELVSAYRLILRREFGAE